MTIWNSPLPSLIEGKPIPSIDSWPLTDLVGFQEPGVIPEALIHNLTQALVITWNERVMMVLDQIVPVWLLPALVSQRVHWFSKELQEMKQEKS